MAPNPPNRNRIVAADEVRVDIPSSLGVWLRSGDHSTLLLVGPTAVGKSELAVAVAEQSEAEIISADAFQVYAGMDVLTAKPNAALRARVPHHLVGEVPLNQAWDVAQWLAIARRRIEEIHARGRRVIVVGGTGLYLRALTRGLAELPASSPELRMDFEAQALPELQRRLAELDAESAQVIDLSNRRRVIRALEVCLLTGRPFSSFRGQWEGALAGFHGVVLTRIRDGLYQRINHRTEAMFNAGVVEEVRALGEVGSTASQTLGLREIRAHLAGKLTREECIAAIQQATRRYAKRQVTWFRREPAFQVIDLSASENCCTLRAH